MDSLKKIIKCGICSQKIDPSTFFSVPEMMMGSGDIFTYGKCNAFGCVQIVEPPSDIDKYYSGYYGRKALSP